MTILLLLVLLLVVTSAVALVRALGRDGYGTRPVPRSHPADLFDPLARR